MSINLKSLILNLLFPIECAGCSKEDTWLCENCLNNLSLGQNKNCIFCGKNMPSGETCPACAANCHLDGVLVCADFKNLIISTLIKKLKYSFAKEISNTLGEIANQYFSEIKNNSSNSVFIINDYTISPIPLHKKRLAWRGFNQSELIAKSISLQQNLPYEDILIRSIHKTPQVKLNAKNRHANIAGCFSSVGKNLSDKKFLLIDDVATTGATLNEAAKVLKKAGAKAVWGLVIAKG